MHKKQSADSLLEGSITAGIIRYALPLIGSSLVQQLYTTVDLIFAGQFIGKEATAAIGATSLIITCMIVFFNGLATGCSILTAQYYGAKQWNGIDTIMTVMSRFSIAGGMVLMILGLFCTPVFLTWVNTPDEIMVHACSYLQIYMLSMIPIIAYNVCSGIVRAMGDTKKPMIVQMIGSILNLFGNYVFVFLLQMKIAGVAWATFLSQTFSAAAIMVIMMKTKRKVRIQRKQPEAENRLGGWKVFSNILRIGIPIGLQSMSITFSNILIQSQINGLGVDSVAAFTCYFRVEMIVYLPVLALSQTMATYVGQNYGAGNYKRMKKGAAVCLAGGIILTVVIAAIVICFKSSILRIFTNDQDVISISGQIIFIAFISYFLYSIIESLSSFLRGIGDSFSPMVVTITCFCVIKVLALFYFAEKYRSAPGMALCYPVSWTIAVIILIIILIVRYRHGKKVFLY